MYPLLSPELLQPHQSRPAFFWATRERVTRARHKLQKPHTLATKSIKFFRRQQGKKSSPRQQTILHGASLEALSEGRQWPRPPTAEEHPPRYLARSQYNTKTEAPRRREKAANKQTYTRELADDTPPVQCSIHMQRHKRRRANETGTTAK